MGGVGVLGYTTYMFTGGVWGTWVGAGHCMHARPRRSFHPLRIVRSDFHLNLLDAQESKLSSNELTTVGNGRRRCPVRHTSHTPRGTSDFEVVDEGRLGYGLRARRHLARGTVALRDPPIAVLRATSLHEAFQSDHQIRRLASDASKESSSASPWSDSKFWPAPERASTGIILRFAELEFNKLTAAKQEQWLSLADAFSRGTDKLPGNVLRSNAFTNPSTGDNHLFERISRANHSCHPNMHRSFDGDVGVLTLLRDALPGETLSISYLSDADLELPTEQRRALLETRFNFVCECERCGPASTQAAKVGWRVAEDTIAVQEAAAAEQQVAVVAAAQGTMVAPAVGSDAAAALEAAQAALSWHLQACAAQLRAGQRTPGPRDPGRAAADDAWTLDGRAALRGGISHSDPARAAPSTASLVEAIKLGAQALAATELARRALQLSRATAA